MLGISPCYIQIRCQASYNPSEKHHLGSLRLVLTTGTPLSIEHHDFIKQHVGEKVFLFNGSGGTGTIGQYTFLQADLRIPTQMSIITTYVCTFLRLLDLIHFILCYASGGCLALPHHYRELQMPMLGSKIKCWDDNGGLLYSRQFFLVLIYTLYLKTATFSRHRRQFGSNRTDSQPTTLFLEWSGWQTLFQHILWSICRQRSLESRWLVCKNFDHSICRAHVLKTDFHRVVVSPKTRGFHMLGRSGSVLVRQMHTCRDLGHDSTLSVLM
jgi:hypothetical protein